MRASLRKHRPRRSKKSSRGSSLKPCERKRFPRTKWPLCSRRAEPRLTACSIQRMTSPCLSYNERRPSSDVVSRLNYDRSVGTMCDNLGCHGSSISPARARGKLGEEVSRLLHPPSLPVGLGNTFPDGIRAVPRNRPVDPKTVASLLPGRSGTPSPLSRFRTDGASRITGRLHAAPLRRAPWRCPGRARSGSCSRARGEISTFPRGAPLPPRFGSPPRESRRRCGPCPARP